jgi:hypothetical protein
MPPKGSGSAKKITIAEARLLASQNTARRQSERAGALLNDASPLGSGKKLKAEVGTPTVMVKKEKEDTASNKKVIKEEDASPSLKRDLDSKKYTASTSKEQKGVRSVSSSPRRTSSRSNGKKTNTQDVQKKTQEEEEEEEEEEQVEVTIESGRGRKVGEKKRGERSRTPKRNPVSRVQKKEVTDNEEEIVSNLQREEAIDGSEKSYTFTESASAYKRPVEHSPALISSFVAFLAFVLYYCISTGIISLVHFEAPLSFCSSYGSSDDVKCLPCPEFGQCENGKLVRCSGGAKYVISSDKRRCVTDAAFDKNVTAMASHLVHMVIIIYLTFQFITLYSNNI